MSKHQWTILCRKSIVDRDDNSLSLIEELEEVTTLGPIPKSIIENKPQIKALSSIGIQLVTLWIRSDRKKPEKGTARVRVKSPNGKILLDQEYSIALENTIRHRHILRFPALPFNGIGIYSYITQQNKGTEKKPKWVTISELFLDVKGNENISLEEITF